MKVFIEEQKFNQLFVIIGLIMALLIVSGFTFKEWETISKGSNIEILGSLSGLILVILIGILFLNLKLKTRVDEKGVSYQYVPFQLAYKVILWENISKSYIRKYDAISEFGGWGLRFNFFRKTGKSITTSGNIGLQIVLKTGSKILIGTQKKEDLQSVLNTYQDKIKTHES
jgi:hypothetical protein